METWAGCSLSSRSNIQATVLSGMNQVPECWPNAWTHRPIFTVHYLIFNRTCPGKDSKQASIAWPRRSPVGIHIPNRSIISGLRAISLTSLLCPSPALSATFHHDPPVSFRHLCGSTSGQFLLLSEQSPREGSPSLYSRVSSGSQFA